MSGPSGVIAMTRQSWAVTNSQKHIEAHGLLLYCIGRYLPIYGCGSSGQRPFIQSFPLYRKVLATQLSAYLTLDGFEVAQAKAFTGKEFVS